MSDDEEESFPGLLEALRAKFGLHDPQVPPPPPDTKVLENARYINDNAIDVAIDMQGTKEAATLIWKAMQEKQYSFHAWSDFELHPDPADAAGTLRFILTMDILNFCFWTPEDRGDQVFTVEYRGKLWTGYKSLVAALQRALDEEIPITTSDFWQSRDECTIDVLRHVFRSATPVQLPLLEERLDCLQEAGQVLYEQFDCDFARCIDEANGSAAALVNLLAKEFSCFRDEVEFEGRKVRLLKRAQILVADIWACFHGEGYGAFDDIDKLTMFADYRVPQMLNSLGCLSYSPPLDAHIRQKRLIESGHSWEVQLRGCSIWAVELLLREIKTAHPDAKVNAVLIDFFLYDTVKEQLAEGVEHMPHHRTRSIWY